MAGTNKLFTLRAGASDNLSVSGTSATVSIAASKSGSEDTIRLASNVDCNVRLTNGAGTAVLTDVLIFANSPEAFAIPEDATHLSAITSGATGTVNWAISKGC